MKKELNIAFFGSSLVSAYWNGAATYYRGIISSLHRKGHKITFYEPDAFERQEHRDIPDPEYASSKVYKADLATVNEMLIDASSADVIIKASGVGVFDEYLEKEVTYLKKPNNLVIFWDVDAPATLERIGNNPSDPFITLIPKYDLILTYGGGKPVVDKYKSFGARECVPVYNALDPDTHFPVPPDKRFDALLGFLGNRMPDREERVMEFFFKTAAALPEHRFILGGNGWQQNVAVLPNVKYIGHVYTADHNAFNSSVRAVLNISRDSMARYGFSPATRVFEAAGAGACIITDAWNGIEEFLEPGRECLVASDSDEVLEQLSNLSERKARMIGEAALKRVLSEHTYMHRSVLLENLLFDYFDIRTKAV